MRATLLLLLLLCAPLPAQARPSCAEGANLTDFDALLESLAQRYAYLDPGRTQLAQIRQRLRPLAAAAGTRDALIRVL